MYMFQCLAHVGQESGDFMFQSAKFYARVLYSLPNRNVHHVHGYVTWSQKSARLLKRWAF
jgi:hypothetical protein